jgi:hypothetical protein
VGNTVGSLLEPQHSIVIGTLLGDGAMRCKTNALLEINHSVRQQTYVDWKFGHLAELVSTSPKQRAGNGGRTAYRFVTRSLPELTPYYRLFYSEGRKVAPEVALTPLAMAVWMMDDGSRSRRALYLNTQQFDVASQHRLLRLLEEQWGIAGTLNRDKCYHRIRLSVVGTARFAEVVSPHVVPEFKYKLRFDPVTTEA